MEKTFLDYFNHPFSLDRYFPFRENNLVVDKDGEFFFEFLNINHFKLLFGKNYKKEFIDRINSLSMIMRFDINSRSNHYFVGRLFYEEVDIDRGCITIYYIESIKYGKKTPFLEVRGYGHLTGVGGCNLKQEEAFNVQEQISKYLCFCFNWGLPIIME